MHVIHDVVSVERVEILRDNPVHIEYHSGGYFDVERVAFDECLPDALATVKPSTFFAVEIVKLIFACERGFNLSLTYEFCSYSQIEAKRRADKYGKRSVGSLSQRILTNHASDV